MGQHKAEAEQITFYSHWLPTLAPGEYRVTATPALKTKEPKKTDKPKKTEETEDIQLATHAVTETFHVGGPRYALTGSEAYSCYPAPGQIGQFYDTLPHIVFDRCTLPWERTIDGANPTSPHDPWLALILLTDADFTHEPEPHVPLIVSRTLAEALKPKEQGVIAPSLQLDPYDAESDLCRTIDLPVGVFSAVMPRKEDLQYLAHVREVHTGNKETWSLLKEGKFSVVVCNRFPESQAMATGEKDWGIVNTMCLVSLEGWGDYLNRKTLPPGIMNCRVLVLGSWQFTCQGSGAFKSLMTRLDDKSLLSPPPLSGNAGQASAYINTAAQMGFVPVNHDLRNADKTISWYRGPLVPMSYERSMSYPDISCADAALRYHPDTGMFDASYAAAWQLGRLLTLQDQAFAQALFRFRTEYQRWIRRTNTDALGAMAHKGTELQRKLGSTGESLQDWYRGALNNAGWLRDIHGTVPGRSAAPPPTIPATVQNWLGQALLLYGVPFHYLVPDEAMLPAESIRFFYLNPEWLNCLLQGACSVGRTSETDELVDQLLRAHFFEVSEKLAYALRSSAKYEADQRRVGTDHTTEPVSVSDGQPPQGEALLHWPLSGYLLRSDAVEAWVGLEAKATGVDSAGNRLEPLQILRMDRLAPDILLCICNGQVTEIEVTQPPEAIHFGAASKPGGGYQKTQLRTITGNASSLGATCEGTVQVPMDTRGRRVVKVSELAADIRKKLVERQQLANTDVFTSAEFAVEMIESPAKVIFSAPA